MSDALEQTSKGAVPSRDSAAVEKLVAATSLASCTCPLALKKQIKKNRAAGLLLGPREGDANVNRQT